MTRHTLTKRQHEIYSFIERTIIEDMCPPTIREIAQEFDIASCNGVVCHLRALEAKGWIAIEKNSSRGIRLARDWENQSNGK